jgi:hypothetical protein
MAQATVQKKKSAATASSSKITSEDLAAGAWLNMIASQMSGSIHSAKLWAALPGFKALTKTATPELWGALLSGAFAMHDESGHWGKPSRRGKAIGVKPKTCDLIDSYCLPSLVDLLSRRKVSLTSAQHAVYTLALARWLAGKERADFQRLKTIVIEWAKANPGQNSREISTLVAAVEHSHCHRVFCKELKSLIRVKMAPPANVSARPEAPLIRSSSTTG